MSYEVIGIFPLTVQMSRRSSTQLSNLLQQILDQLKDLRYTDVKTMDEFILKFDSLKSHWIVLGVTLNNIHLIHVNLKMYLPRQFQQFITKRYSTCNS